VVMNVDIYPTLLAAAQLPVDGNLDGHNLWPYILNDIPPPERHRGWEIYSPAVNVFRYGFLSDSGRWRLVNSQGTQDQLYDLDAAPEGQVDTAPQHQDVVTSLASQYWQHHWDKGQLPVSGTVMPGGTRTEYSGFDTMRTPYENGFTIGLEIGPLQDVVFEHGQRVELAGQDGVWSLSYQHGEGLQWQLGSNVLTGGPFDPSRCNAIVLSGYVDKLRHLSVQEPRSELKLFVSGGPQDVLRDADMPSLPEAALGRPTFVNYGGSAYFANLMLSSYAESYSPRVSDQVVWIYEALFKDEGLAMADVSMMDRQLCRGNQVQAAD